MLPGCPAPASPARTAACLCPFRLPGRAVCPALGPGGRWTPWHAKRPRGASGGANEVGCWIRLPSGLGSGAGVVGGALAAGALLACQHRPARSLHPGRGGRTRLPPRGPLAGPLQAGLHTRVVLPLGWPHWLATDRNYSRVILSTGCGNLVHERALVPHETSNRCGAASTASCSALASPLGSATNGCTSPLVSSVRIRSFTGRLAHRGSGPSVPSTRAATPSASPWTRRPVRHGACGRRSSRQRPPRTRPH